MGVKDVGDIKRIGIIIRDKLKGGRSVVQWLHQRVVEIDCWVGPLLLH